MSFGMTPGLLERIFQRKHLKALIKENEELIEINNKLIAGDYVPLTQFERRMIIDALIDPCYLSKVHAPKTKYVIRQTWKTLKEKIKMFEVLEDKG